MKRLSFTLILAAAVLMLAAGVQAVVWERYAMEGGVVNDIAFITESGNEMVLCVCMANGLFYKTYSNGWENLWNEELPGKLCFGVDAVYQGGEILALCSTEGKRVWKGTYDGNWGDWLSYTYDITLDESYYQNAEHYPGHYEDAAFCCVNGSYDFDHVFCILNDYEEAGTQYNRSGIYYWYEDDNKWLICSETLHLNFSHFYRDKEDQKYLYAVGEAGIYMFDGQYGIDRWMDINGLFFRGIDLAPVLDFQQESQPPYRKYILVKSDFGMITLDDTGKAYQVSMQNVDLDTLKSALSETSK